MVEQIPRVSRYEPTDIIEAFLSRQDKHNLAQEAAARQLEIMPIEQKMQIERMEAAKRLGIQYLEPELNIRDRIAARAEERAEGRGMRERTHSADQQIRANREQLTLSNDLAEGRAVRSEDRAHGYYQKRSDIDEARDVRRSEREETEATNRAWTAEGVRRSGKEFDEPFEARRDTRLLERQSKLLDERAADARELATLRGDITRQNATHNWMEKSKFYDSHPELARGVAGGKVKMIEEGVVGIKPEDIVTLTNAKREVDKYEYLGAGQNDKGELVEKFRLKKPAPKGEMVPSQGTRQLPAAGSRNPYENTAPSVPAGKSAVPPASTPKGDKSGERIQKSEINWLATPEEAPNQFRNLFDRVGQRYDLSPNLLASMMKQESGYRNTALSPAGAGGTMQFMPGTADRFNVDRGDPNSSVVGAAKYINKMLGMFDDNIGLALAGYNWGEGGKNSDRGVSAWLRSGADPRKMPAETKNYVQSITGQPIEYWVDKFFNDREGVSRVGKTPRVTPTNQKNAAGDDLFYVDVG